MRKLNILGFVRQSRYKHERVRRICDGYCDLKIPNKPTNIFVYGRLDLQYVFLILSYYLTRQVCCCRQDFLDRYACAKNANCFGTLFFHDLIKEQMRFSKSVMNFRNHNRTLITKWNRRTSFWLILKGTHRGRRLPNLEILGERSI